MTTFFFLGARPFRSPRGRVTCGRGATSPGKDVSGRTPEWWNWKTRSSQKAVTETSCGFDPRLGHHASIHAHATDRVHGCRGFESVGHLPAEGKRWQRLAVRDICGQLQIGA